MTVFRPPQTPGPNLRDFEAYYAAGRTYDAGGDPYSRDVWATERSIAGVDPARDELLPFVGPAAALPLWGALARLPQPVAVRVWSGVLGIAFFLLVFALLALAHAPRDPWLFVLLTGFAFANGPAISDLALGQVALVAAAGIAVALVAYRARRAPEAFVATLCAAFQPNLALALIGRVRTRWDVAIAASTAAAFIALTLAVGGGPRGLTGYVRRLHAHGDAERFITIQQTPAAIAHSFGTSPLAAAAIGDSIALIALITAVVVAVRARLGPVSTTLLALAVLPLAVPFFHEHDFIVELIPLAVLALNARGDARILSAVAAVCVLVDWFGFAQRENAHAQMLAFGVALVAGFTGLGPAALRERSRAAVAGAVTLVAAGTFATLLAAAHPAPTWPDALPRGFRVAAPDASAVWGAEQRAAGLERVDPVWGMLRAIPLAGCVVLAVAVVRHARRRAPDQTSTFIISSNGEI